MKLEIVSRSHEPLRRIAKRAREMADQVDRLRYLRRLLLVVPRNKRWAVLSGQPDMVLMVAMTVTTALAAAVLLWLEL